MAKLYFYYSAMNAGKTTTLLQSSHNYAERGMTTLLLKPLIDDREGLNVIRSRVGLEAEAKNFEKDDNLLQTIETQHKTKSLNCVLVDEAQFLTRDQVIQFGNVVDRLEIPVLCYGLRTDFLGELFEGKKSKYYFPHNKIKNYALVIKKDFPNVENAFHSSTLKFEFFSRNSLNAFLSPI